jgi:hypothetical protein
MTHWIDVTHRDSVFAFAADQYADKCDDDMHTRGKYMRELVRINAKDRKQRVNSGELLYEMIPEPINDMVVDGVDEVCTTRQNAKFNYVAKHKGKVAPKAKQLSDVYFEEQWMSDTYDYRRGF